jgi:hypothetical protein
MYIVVSIVAPNNKRKATLHTIAEDTQLNAVSSGRKLITPSVLFDLERLAHQREPFPRKPNKADLIKRFMARGEEFSEFYDVHMQMVDAILLKSGKSFKVVKFVYTGGGGAAERVRSFDSVFTDMNERTQIIAQYFTRTSATAEVKTILQAIKNRFELHGFSNIKLFDVDDCCHEYPALAEVLMKSKTRVQWQSW